jgi:hypothetical protein
VKDSHPFKEANDSMPCDIRLSIFNEMLRCAMERQSASDERLAECRTRTEGTKEGLRAAQEGLDRAILDEAKARQAHIDWLNYLNARPDKGSAVMRKKLTDLFNASAQAALDTLSVQETVTSFRKTVNEANGDFVLVQAAQRKIAAERTLITSEIAKLSSPSR